MWDKLSIKDKAEIIKMGVANGIRDLDTIRDTYNNVYTEGGQIDRNYINFLNSLPDNLKNTDPNEYNMYRYWELNGKPDNFISSINRPDPLFTLENDRRFHASSVAYDAANDRYEFMKAPLHDTTDMELLQYFNSNDMSNFRKDWKLNMDTNPYLYERRKKGDTNLFAEGGDTNLLNNQDFLNQYGIHWDEDPLMNDYYAQHPSELNKSTTAGIPAAYNNRVLVNRYGIPQSQQSLNRYAKDYALIQPQVSRKEEREVEKRAIDKNIEQNMSQAPLLFSGLSFLNLASPSNIYGTIARQVNPDYYGQDHNWTEDLIFGNAGLFTDKYAEEHPYLSTLSNLFADGVAGAGTIKGVNAIKNGIRPTSSIIDKYLFTYKPGSYTRGIGVGTEGLDDLVKTGIVRGNPRGTEMSAKSFMKGWRHNREHFKDIMQDTKIKGIESKYQSRTLTEKEFNAIKKAAKKYNKPKSETTTYGNRRKIEIFNRQVDPLYDYDSYIDYIDDINNTIDYVENMPGKIASGKVKVNPEQLGYTTTDGIQLPVYRPLEKGFSANSDFVMDGSPLSYWYPDGRNPLTKGHAYASSKYGVRVNNPEDYIPFMHYNHLHPSFLTPPKLSDLNVELFKKGLFGLTYKLDKNTLRSLWLQDFKNSIKKSSNYFILPTFRSILSYYNTQNK